MYHFPTDPKKIKQRIRRYERSLRKDPIHGLRDGYGKRYPDYNHAYLSRVLIDPKLPLTDNSYTWLTPDKISKIRSYAKNTMKPLDRARPKCHDAELVIGMLPIN